LEFVVQSPSIGFHKKINRGCVIPEIYLFQNNFD